MRWSLCPLCTLVPARPRGLPTYCTSRRRSIPASPRTDIPLQLLPTAYHSWPPQLSTATSPRRCAGRPFSTSPRAAGTCTLSNDPRLDSSRYPSFALPVATVTLLRGSRLVRAGRIRLSQRASVHSHPPACCLCNPKDGQGSHVSKGHSSPSSLEYRAISGTLPGSNRGPRQAQPEAGVLQRTQGPLRIFRNHGTCRTPRKGRAQGAPEAGPFRHLGSTGRTAACWHLGHGPGRTGPCRDETGGTAPTPSNIGGTASTPSNMGGMRSTASNGGTPSPASIGGTRCAASAPGPGGTGPSIESSPSGRGGNPALHRMVTPSGIGGTRSTASNGGTPSTASVRGTRCAASAPGPGGTGPSTESLPSGRVEPGAPLVVASLRALRGVARNGPISPRPAWSPTCGSTTSSTRTLGRGQQQPTAWVIPCNERFPGSRATNRFGGAPPHPRQAGPTTFADLALMVTGYPIISSRPTGWPRRILPKRLRIQTAMVPICSTNAWPVPIHRIQSAGSDWKSPESRGCGGWGSTLNPTAQRPYWLRMD